MCANGLLSLLLKIPFRRTTKVLGSSEGWKADTLSLSHDTWGFCPVHGESSSFRGLLEVGSIYLTGDLIDGGEGVFGIGINARAPSHGSV